MKNTQHNRCKIAIFYEKHSDYLQARTIKDLLPFLVSQGFTVYASEEGHDKPMSDTVATLTKVVKRGYQTMTSRGVSPKEASEVVKSMSETANLLGSLKQHGMKYVAVDMSDEQRDKISTNHPLHHEVSKARNDFIIKNIQKACDDHNSGIVFLAGLNHLVIEQPLRDKGHEIFSFYTPSQASECDRDPSSSMRCSDPDVRSGNAKFKEKYKHEIHVFDAHKNPDIDHVGEIKNIIDPSHKIFMAQDALAEAFSSGLITGASTTDATD